MITQESNQKYGRQYRLPRGKLSGFLWSVLTRQVRSIARDGRHALAELEPDFEIFGEHHIPGEGPCLVTCNHYTRPGFGAWWLILLISGALAVRETLRAAKMASRTGGFIGLAPEGRDFEGELGQLPPGAGDFMALLTRTGLPIRPVGVAGHV